jgi:hypothetical protein
MRFLRAFVGVVGASGSVIAAGGIMLAVLSAALAFHGWPDVRARGPHAIGTTELAEGVTSSTDGDGPEIRRAAAVTVLPAVPVAASRTRRATRTARARRRGAAEHERPSATRPTRGSAKAPKTSSQDATPGAGDAPAGGPTPAASAGGEPTRPVQQASAGASSGGPGVGKRVV